jgi:hypothetical protein
MAQDQDFVYPTKEPDTIIDNTGDAIFMRIRKLVSDHEVRISEELPDWLDGQEMYEDCFDAEEVTNKLYNPYLLVDVTSRLIDELRLADYILRIPGSQGTERAAVQDYITQIEQESGLYSEIRDDDKGGLSWTLLGSLLLMWSKPDKDMIKRGIPIKFQTLRLTQAYFGPGNITRIRDYNGDAIADEAFLVWETSYDEALEQYPIGIKDGPLTGASFDKGRIPTVIRDEQLQTEKENSTDFDTTTEIGYYYNIRKGVFQVRIGSSATIVEEYNEEKGGTYPYKLDGNNYIPIELLKCYPVLGKFYGKGTYHRYGKIARNDAKRRNMAHKYAEQNVLPDRFVKMAEDRYATFQNELDLHRQIVANGGSSYLHLDPNEEVQTGDLRTAPLSQDFERMKNDDIELIRQSGISIMDVDIPASQKATNTVAQERNKTRMPNHIVKVNAGAAMFIRRIILQFVRDYIKDGCTGIVATNAKIRDLDIDDENKAKIEKMVANGAPDEAVRAYMMKNSKPGKTERPLGELKCSVLADYIRKKNITVQEDFSAWNEIEYRENVLKNILQYVVGTPLEMEVKKELAALYGYDVYVQDLQVDPNQVAATNAQASLQNSLPTSNDTSRVPSELAARAKIPVPAGLPSEPNLRR